VNAQAATLFLAMHRRIAHLYEWVARASSMLRAHTRMHPGKTYDPVAADAAWRLSQDFLKRRLH
jgi:hypothetical protein